jgi:hypothetical protein
LIGLLYQRLELLACMSVESSINSEGDLMPDIFWIKSKAALAVRVSEFEDARPYLAFLVNDAYSVPYSLQRELCPHLRDGAQQRLNLRLTILFLRARNLFCTHPRRVARCGFMSRFGSLYCPWFTWCLALLISRQSLMCGGPRTSRVFSRNERHADEAGEVSWWTAALLVGGDPFFNSRNNSSQLRRDTQNARDHPFRDSCSG